MNGTATTKHTPTCPDLVLPTTQLWRLTYPLTLDDEAVYYDTSTEQLIITTRYFTDVCHDRPGCIWVTAYPFIENAGVLEKRVAVAIERAADDDDDF
jgi:hypothetical protein